MIEVSARLSQGVFLAGETVEVAVTVKNPSPPRDAKSQWNDLEEVLAWASAQIHCQAWMSAAKVSLPPHHTFAREETAVSNSRTSFAPCSSATGPSNVSAGSSGMTSTGGRRDGGALMTGDGDKKSGSNLNVTSRVVVSTKPVILLCDLRLLPGESKTFWYKETLPVEGPPSFRGQAVKYAYKLTIGTQRVNAPIRLLRVPLRALVLQEFSDSALALNTSGSEDATLHPSNPFLSETADSSGGNDDGSSSSYNCPSSYLDSALQVLQIVTSSRHQKFYNVTNARGHVVKFCIFKQAYKLGEDIVGSLDFSGTNNVPCLQYAVTLQSVEEVSAECRKSESQKPSISSFSKSHEMCVGYGQTHFVLPVPLHVTPSFYTEIVSLKWRLHFEFVTSTEEAGGGMMKPKDKPKRDDMNGAGWVGPTDIHIETMVWDLPIKLYPNLPSYISQGLQMQTLYDMKISNNNNNGPSGGFP